MGTALVIGAIVLAICTVIVLIVLNRELREEKWAQKNVKSKGRKK